MPLQNFVDGGLPTIKAAWLNAVDAFYFTLFNSATTTSAARTALDVYSTTQVDAADALKLSLTGGTMTGPVNMALSTYNTNTATPDIWTGMANSINYTNTTTATGLQSAPQAGVTRRLYFTGAQKFTTGTGANKLVIPGIASGKTVTMNAGAVMDIFAATASTFVGTYTLGGSFTATSANIATGVSSITMYYLCKNGLVHMNSYTDFLYGTGTGTAFDITGMPVEIRPPTTESDVFGVTIKETATITNDGLLAIANTGTMSLYKTAARGVWTTGQGWYLFQTQFTYML